MEHAIDCGQNASDTLWELTQLLVNRSVERGI